MNQKKAKAARRIARELSKGMPERKLVNAKHQIKSAKVNVMRMQAVNDPQSTRGIYRRIKVFLRRGASLDQIRVSIAQ